jgi:hypothetical protein
MIVFLDCAQLCLWKESEVSSHRSTVLCSNDDRFSLSGTSVILLEEVYGIDSDFELDFEKYVLSIVCRQRIITLAFCSHETLALWCSFLNGIFGKG